MHVADIGEPQRRGCMHELHVASVDLMEKLAPRRSDGLELEELRGEGGLLLGGWARRESGF